ncbi:hypothetical protein EPH95_12185 [Salicibibacter halophilus]|uniref:Competence protein n=1 Tax=Salicibibacter halophilus TaxID=2502791 RepID=A0A514LJ40_9BACI|nr:competence protein ComK [Salicibibacter halophilus]QDI91842.1 hypothetical protein EPH95_12185 [Salicibibacter halophilus]
MEQTMRAVYRVSANTMAILPAAQGSIIYERNQTVVHCREKPLHIIRRSCLDGGSSLEGRLDAVRYKTKLARKLPIPINMEENWFAFPTAGLRDHDCCWVFYQHIDSVVASQGEGCHIYFRDQQMIAVKKSLYTLHRQLQRTGWIMSLFLIR